MKRTSAPFVLLPLLAGCPEGALDLGTILLDFEQESGHDFMDCGQRGVVDCELPVDGANLDEDFRGVSACLLEAWNSCTAVTGKLNWYNLSDGYNSTRDVYIVPAGDKCKVLLFRLGARTYDRHDCSVLAEKGACGVLEPQSCEFVESHDFN